MGPWKQLFQSQDSKYFIRTAFHVTLVPVLTLMLITYSIWMYVDMNYHFFVGRGFLPANGDFKEAFFEHLLAGVIDNSYWLGIFLVGVFFVGLFMAHLVLRPFARVQRACRDLLNGQAPEQRLDPISKRQLVVRACLCLVDYLRLLQDGQAEEHRVHPSLEKIYGPTADRIFYFQYVVCTILLSVITTMAVHLTLQQLHEEIAETAISLLKGNAEVARFLMSQDSTVQAVAAMCSLFSVVMYGLTARSLVRDVEGASYAYLRDIRDIVTGEHSKRLKPRFLDPGKGAAIAINEVLDTYLEVESALPPLPEEKEVV